MAQKKHKAKNLRNVLVTPFSINWSENSPEGVTLLKKALEDLLPLAKLEKKSLNMLSKDEAKEQIHPRIPYKEQNNIFRSYIVPGFQSVVRGLEKGELCCVVLSGDIRPPMMQRVICSYCNSYNIPIVVVPELKTITNSALGFSAMVIGFKKVAESPEHQFFRIYEIVSQNRCIFETPFVAKQDEKEISERGKEYSIINKKSFVTNVKAKDCYLFRKGKNDRIFRPGKQSTVGTKQFQSFDEDFISLGKSGTKAGDLENLGRNIENFSDKSKDIDSDCDSVDEDDMFFVDNKPDDMLLEVEPSSNEEKNSQLKSSKKFDKKTNKSAKKQTERYFLSKGNQDVSHKKDRDVKQGSKQKAKRANLGNGTEKATSPNFNPLTIKTIISNPKKTKRKKK